MTPIRQMAEELAASLFQNGSGETAARLVLELPGGRDGGGLCEAAVVSRIEHYLEVNLRKSTEADGSERKSTEADASRPIRKPR